MDNIIFEDPKKKQIEEQLFKNLLKNNIYKKLYKNIIKWQRSNNIKHKLKDEEYIELLDNNIDDWNIDIGDIFLDDIVENLKVFIPYYQKYLQKLQDTEEYRENYLLKMVNKKYDSIYTTSTSTITTTHATTTHTTTIHTTTIHEISDNEECKSISEKSSTCESICDSELNCDEWNKILERIDNIFK